MPYRSGVDDGEVLMLAWLEQSWVLLNLAGEIAYHNDRISRNDADSACDWAHTVAVSLADIPPPKPNNSITAAHCYTFHIRNGLIEARLAPGMAHFDGRGWVVVDARGKVIARNDDLAESDGDNALEWANRIIESQPGSRLIDC